MITKIEGKGYLVYRGEKIHIASENRWLNKKNFIHSDDWKGVYHKTLKSAQVADTMMKKYNIPEFIQI